jgi:GxxExxY protein
VALQHEALEPVDAADHPQEAGVSAAHHQVSGVGRGSLRRETGDQEIRRKIFSRPSVAGFQILRRCLSADVAENAIRTLEAHRSQRFFEGPIPAMSQHMLEVPASVLDALKEQVIGCAINVHRAFGPGLLESIHQQCMVIELRAAGLSVERERRVLLKYRDERVGGGLKIDLVVNGCLIVEVKAVERIHPIHLAQVITYLKLTGLPEGLLMNFNTTALRAGLRSVVHPDLYRARLLSGHQ